MLRPDLSAKVCGVFATSLKLLGRFRSPAACAHPPCDDDISAEPYRYYAGKGYTNLGDWLGTGFTHHPNISKRPELSCKSGVSGLVSQRFQL
jgi:hypothetical protein